MRVDKLEKFKGFLVPFIVLRKGDEVFFKINDEAKVTECIEKRLCSICGEELYNDMWLIGGKLSAFHPHGVYADIPVHKECGVYALQVCPYMAYTQYIAKTDTSKLQESLNKDSDAKYILVNPTQDSIRLQYFVFVHIKDYQLKYTFPHRYIVPERPFIEFEFWRDGVQISQEQVNELDNGHK